MAHPDAVDSGRCRCTCCTTHNRGLLYKAGLLQGDSRPQRDNCPSTLLPYRHLSMAVKPMEAASSRNEIMRQPLTPEAGSGMQPTSACPRLPLAAALLL